MRLLRVGFWVILVGFAGYGLYALGRGHAAWVGVACVVLLVGGLAVAERPRGNDK